MFYNNKFLLMNKDVPVLRFVYTDEGISKVFKEVEWIDKSLKPIGYNNLSEWLESRQIAKHRSSIENLLREIGCLNLEGFIRTTHGLTLNDTFWVKESDSTLSWRDVSLYTNPFDDVIARIAFEGGLYGKHFNSTSPEFGVSGNYKKCWVREENDIYLLKGGSSGFANSGLEPYCEGLAAQLSKLICSNAVDYDIVNYRGHTISKCKLFTDETLGYASIGSVLGDNLSDNDIFEFYKSIDCGDDYRRMVVLDALILNQDRHLGNYGVLFNNDTLNIERAAPVFDHNLSLLVYAMADDLKDVDVYLSKIGPKIGDDFNEIAHKLLTPEIKSDLKNLRGFEFDFSKCPIFSNLRKETLNALVNKQIDKILNDVKLYVPDMRKQEDFSWQTEGWPDDLEKPTGIVEDIIIDAENRNEKNCFKTDINCQEKEM